MREIDVNSGGRSLVPVTLPPPYSIALLRHRILPVPFFLCHPIRRERPGQDEHWDKADKHNRQRRD